MNAFYNVCRHRGTRLCAETEGSLGRSIQCPYHAWTYDLDGSLIGAPHMDEVPHFDKSDYPLHRVHADVWDGHIFINMSRETPPPLREQLADLPSRFTPWRMQELRLGRRIVYEVKANWKLIIQNYNECLHCPNLHPALNKLSHYLSGENDPLQPTYMGGRMDLRPGIDTLTMTGKCSRDPLPGLSSDDARRVYYYAIFPNMLLSLHPDYMMVHSLWPQSADRTINICEWHFHPSEVARPGFNADDAVDFWDLVACLHAGPVLEPGGSALRLRSHDHRATRAIGRSANRSADQPIAPVFRFGSKNGVLTTVALTLWRTASTVTSICSCVPSAKCGRLTVASAIIFLSVGDHVVVVARPT